VSEQFVPSQRIEPLFRAMMKDVLELTPASKEEGLSRFREQGYFLIDATYTPVNQLPDSKKEAIILRDFPLLVEALHEYAGPETAIVLVKANVYKLLEPKLRDLGFNVLNQEVMIPFPSSGQQSKFRSAIQKVLGL